jgi:hypothetical protein
MTNPLVASRLQTIRNIRYNYNITLTQAYAICSLWNETHENFWKDRIDFEENEYDEFQAFVEKCDLNLDLLDEYRRNERTYTDAIVMLQEGKEAKIKDILLRIHRNDPF